MKSFDLVFKLLLHNSMSPFQFVQILLEIRKFIDLLCHLRRKGKGVGESRGE